MKDPQFTNAFASAPYTPKTSLHSLNFVLFFIGELTKLQKPYSPLNSSFYKCLKVG